MTRSLGNGTVDVELGTGSWSARWPAAEVHAGPFGASVDIDGLALDTRDAPGTWNVSAGSAFGRAGAWARWTARDGGVWLRLHVPADGSLLVVEGGVRAEPDDTAGALVLAVGPFGFGSVDTLATTELRRLVATDGGPAWTELVTEDASGSTGRAALVVAASGAGPAFGVQALHGGEPVGTALSIVEGRLAPDGSHPPEVRVDVIDPRAGRARGDDVRSEAVAFGAGRDPIALADELAALASRTSG